MMDDVDMGGQASQTYGSYSGSPEPGEILPAEAEYLNDRNPRGNGGWRRPHDASILGRGRDHYHHGGRFSGRNQGDRGRSRSPVHGYGESSNQREYERSSYRDRHYSQSSQRHEDWDAPRGRFHERATLPDRRNVAEALDYGSDHADNSRLSRPQDRSPSPQRGNGEGSQHVTNKSYPLADIRRPSRTQPPAPSTAFPLRDYSDHIARQFGNDRIQTEETRHLPRFRNGDGRVNPRSYGGTAECDLGLCYTTFMTRFACELGDGCFWRHHPLAKTEKDWVVRVGGQKGRNFLDRVSVSYDSPAIPVPGANMSDVIKRERRRECEYDDHYCH